MDERTFQQAMTYLAAAYNKELPKEQAAVYWDQLQDLDDEPFLVAVKATVSTEDRMPSVATLRHAYREERRRARQAQPPPRLPAPANPQVARYYLDLMRELLR